MKFRTCQRIAWSALGGIVCALSFALPAWSQDREPPSLSAGDYAFGNEEWNGLSEFVQVANDLGIDVQPAASVDFSTLVPEDRLIFIYPTTEIPTNELAEFVIDGGKVLLADDFGQSQPFLKRLGITRHPLKQARHAEYYLGRPSLPMFQPGGRHPLLQDVQSVVANHPSALKTEGGAILPYQDPIYGLVYDMRLALGKVVVIADASILINHMLQVRDNKRFIANTLQYLCQDVDPCRPRVLVGGVEFNGAYSARNSPEDETVEQLESVLDQINETFQNLDTYVPPRNAVYYASVLLMGGVIVFLLTIFPVRRSQDIEPEVGPPDEMRPLSEFEWNLKRYERSSSGSNFVLPVAILRTEFERLFFQELADGEHIPPPEDSTRNAFLRRIAQRYADRLIDAQKGTAGDKVRTYRQTLSLLNTLSKIPPRHRLFLDSEVSFNARDLMNIHTHTRTILYNLSLDEEYDRRTRNLFTFS